MTDVSTTVAHAAARLAVRGGLDVPGPVLRVDDDAWPRVLGRLEGQRLVGLALIAVEEGRLDLTDAQVDGLAAVHRGWMAAALQRERLLLEVDRRMREVGVTCVVVKGTAFAHAFYPDPSWRPFGDLDLLVATEDWSVACGVLASMGMERGRPEPRPGFEQRFGKAAMHRTDEGIEVDLHRTLVLGPFGLWLDPDELLAHRVPFDLGGQPVGRLDDTACWIHACIHAALGLLPHMLLPVRDVLQIARHGEVDWELAERWVRDWRLAAVIGRAAALVRDDLGVELPAPALRLAAMHVARREERALQAYVTGRRHHGGTATATLRAIPSWSDKAAYVRALVAPTPDFVEARHGAGDANGYARRWRRAAAWLTSGAR